MANAQTSAAERKKYREVWSYEDYARFSPGEQFVPLFKQLVRKRGTLIDLGAGTGRATEKLEQAGFRTSYHDFAPNARRIDHRDTFAFNLWRPWPQGYHWALGYCCDVMEHIPPEHVDKVLKNIAKHVDRAFFSISFNPDAFGKRIGKTLHLSLHSFTEWRDWLSQYFELAEARDLIGEGVFFGRAL